MSCSRPGKPSVKLLHFSRLPPHLQYNPYILSGYRSAITFYESLLSCLQWHNESINILSHGSPVLGLLFIYLLMMVPMQTVAYVWAHPVLVLTHTAGCLFPCLFSAMYHAFLHCEHDPQIYNITLKVDLLGIWISNSLGFILPIKACFVDHPTVGTFVAFLYILLMVPTLWLLLHSQSARQRCLSMLGFILLRCMLISYRLLFSGINIPEYRAASFNYIWMDIFGVVGGMINVSRLPERWLPGKLDYVLNSHQLMHLMSSGTVLFLHQGALNDLRVLTVMSHV